jgi:hypothetical protein
VVAKARDVFDRCSTGRAREQDVGQMDGALDQMKAAIASVVSGATRGHGAATHSRWF